MQLILLIFSTILPFVTWTLEIHPRYNEIIQNDENSSQKDLQINQTKAIEMYSMALMSSFWFFEAQRSGKMPLNNRIPWRGDSMLHDHGYLGENLSGGYYNSGLTYVKYVFPTAFTTTMLAWGLLTWTEAYRNAGQLEIVRENIKWASDYFIKCHPQEELFYVQVGDEMFERRVYGRLEQMIYKRPAYAANSTNPATDILGEVVAALAATSLVFKTIFDDTRYSDTCLTHAKQLYKLALKYKGSHYDWMPNIYGYEINSYSYHDDLAWSGLWLSRATTDSNYFHDAQHYYEEYNLATNNTIFNYYNKVPGIEVLFNQIISYPKSPHTKAVHRYLDTLINNVTRTKKGLAFFSDDDTLSLAANAAFLCLIALSSNNKMNLSHKYYDFAKEQIDYILGMKTERDYVVGLTSKSPTQIPHKASSCPKWPANCGHTKMMSNEPNHEILYGALVNGPDVHDHFVDIRFNKTDKAYTKIRIDYNAGFTGALAGLLQLDVTWNRDISSTSSTQRISNRTLDYNSIMWKRIMRT
ncbi:uncharacterized protein LOC109857423 [Pseudomyrmex gracilis]|uniref:uncharacterized protein LOC109857423 n=1 Tax=Pseudomyrmex gracilis TaxID=219809 RepID=UPI0009955AB1|nr:uncharacterized protein LOC109857423 [Pseudomyrmex gracilis]